MFLRSVYFFSALLLLSCSSTKQMDDEVKLEGELSKALAIHFIVDANISKLMDVAAKENKPIFMDIYADWCMPCRLMDKEVFTDETLGDFLNENFVSFKVNAEQGSGVDIADLYQVKAYPTLLFLDAQGNIIKRKEGLSNVRELRKLAEYTLNI